MIYLLHGQPKSGKSILGQRLQFWLQTDKKNWRKSVFHIDEEQTELYFQIAKYLDKCGNDVVISMCCPNRSVREQLKSECKVKEIYCHNSKTKDKLPFFEPPQQFFIDLDTSASADETFKKLIKILI